VAEPLTTEELHERLARRVLGREGQGVRAFLFTEFNIENRRADAISVGLWHSRGHKIEGFELKTNRADVERELEDHQKCEPAMAICDHFWLVANPGLIESHELPERWGLLEAAGRKRHLRVRKAAPLLRDEAPPIERGLVASLIKHASTLRWEREREIREEERANSRAGSDLDFQSVQRRMEEAEESNGEMMEAFEEFRRTSGIQFLGWRPRAADLKLIGEIAKALRAGEQGREFLLRWITHQESQAAEMRKHLKTARQAIEAGAS
jgi:hypothetical protein